MKPPIKGQGRVLAVARKLRGRSSSSRKKWKSFNFRTRTLQSSERPIIGNEKFEDGPVIN